MDPEARRRDDPQQSVEIRADLTRLPFPRACLDGIWAQNSYVHMPSEGLPSALHDAHSVLRVGGHLHLTLCSGSGAAADRNEARKPTLWDPRLLDALFEGAGFDVAGADLPGFQLVRQRTLADSVGPDMSVLIVGLNPSLHAADAGVGFVSPSNRFWKTAIEAGLITEPRNPRRALDVDGVGMTDLVKRATTRASEVVAAEYRHGLARLDAMVGLLKPQVVCVVGITGWRAAIGQHVSAGPQSREVGGRPVYLMPNPSGLNAHTSHAGLVEHFQRAMRHS